MKLHLITLSLLLALPSITVQAIPISALDILQNNAGAGDGIYTIDTDGTGGNSSFDIYADMTFFGGGWTLGLVSLENSPSASSDMVANTGTVGINSTHTRDLSLLALNSDTQIRHQIVENGSVIFDGFYTGGYHGIFEADPALWTIATGDLVGTFGAHTLGSAWATVGSPDMPGLCAELYGAWYQNSCYSSIPSTEAGTSVVGGGPYASRSVDAWRIFVREGSSVSANPAAVPEPSMAILFALGFASYFGVKRMAASSVLA